MYLSTFMFDVSRFMFLARTQQVLHRGGTWIFLTPTPPTFAQPLRALVSGNLMSGKHILDNIMVLPRIFSRKRGLFYAHITKDLLFFRT